MDLWNSDLVLHVLQYLNLSELNRVSATGQRYYYLVQEYRRLLGPELVTARSFRGKRQRHKTQADLLQESLDQLQTRPNLALCFSQTRYDSVAEQLSPLDEEGKPRRRLLPRSTAFLEARSSDIQSSHLQHVESNSRYLTMLAHFPKSNIEPFYLDEDDADWAECVQGLQQKEQQDMPWKAFIIYGCGRLGEEWSDEMVSLLQKAYPKAIIVGGFCDEGYLSYHHPVGEGTGIMPIDSGIFGVALGGHSIPMKSVVSRGAKSLIQGGGTTQPTSPIRVDATKFLPHTKQHHLIRFVDESSSFEQTVTFQDLLDKYTDPEFIGIRRVNEDGFRPLEIFPNSYDTNKIAFHADHGGEESYLNAQIDFFDVDGKACKADVLAKMELLREQTKDEEILGALIFTCNGRGPTPGFLIDKAMYDANCFSKIFPQVPCVGFYAGGEIGPEAFVARQQAFQQGKAKLQGFTAVFALFIVPKRDANWAKQFSLDGSPESVKRFCRERLLQVKPKS